MIAAVLVWWLFSGNGPAGPPGNEDRLSSAGPAATPDGAPATSAPDASTPAAGSADAEPSARIDGFSLDGDDVLVLRYRTGPPRCFGRVGTPRVLETAAAVTVRLPLVSPTAPPSGCPGPVRPRTVAVLLDSPLGARSVLDGSFADAVLVEADADSG